MSVRGLLLWSAGAALAFYLAGATALYRWFDRSPYNLITWSDAVLLPVRWEQVRELRGRMMIAEGLDDLKANRWGEAHLKLRAGLSRAPHESRARLALAQFHTLTNHRAAALAVLTGDLASGYPGRAYLTTLFTLATQGEDYEVIITTCDRFLPAVHEDRTWLSLQKIQALLGAGRAADALPLTEGAGAMAKELRVLALLDLGRSAEAVDFLDRWRKEAGADPAQVRRLQVRALREAGRVEEMKVALEEFQQMTPADPRAQVYGIVQLWLAGDEEAAGRAFDRYVQRFAGGASNLTVLASALAEAKAVALLQRCVAEAALHGFPAKPFKTAMLQAQVATGDWAGASRTLAELKGLLTKDATAVERFGYEWLDRLVAVAAQPDEAPAAALLEFMLNRPLPLRLYRQTVEALLLADRLEPAARVLELAERNYATSRTVTALRARVDQAIRAKPVAMVAAAPAAAVEITERDFFARLADLEAAGRWPEAAQAIRELRVARPDWLRWQDQRVLENQMRVAGQTGDTLELLGALNAYHNGDRDRSQWVVGLARELHPRRPEDAELLLREVLRHSPDFPPAMRLKQEWQPPEKR